MRDYVVDDAGRKKAVIIDLEEFTEIMEYVEEIEDALDLKKAVDQGEEFIELRDFVQLIFDARGATRGLEHKNILRLGE